MEGAVLYEHRGQIGYIILNRPHVLNAMNDEWIGALLRRPKPCAPIVWHGSW